MLNEKNIVTVLKYCVNTVGREKEFILPVKVAANFPKIPEEDVYATFDYLHKNEYIKIHQDLISPNENASEYRIEVLNSAFNYLLAEEKSRRDFRKNWKWNIWAAIFTAVISSLLGALLARVSQIFWP
jgi:hypothetical protein